MTNVERALLVAERVHAGQLYDIYPYMYHIRQVWKISVELGYDETTQIICILHDTMEDGDLSYNDILKAFGRDVAEGVFAVTDELGRNRKERKEKTYPKIKAYWKAAAAKVCDRIANVTQSKAYQPGLFAMYVKENKVFYNNIFSEDHPKDEMAKAWDKLDAILS